MTEICVCQCYFIEIEIFVILQLQAAIGRVTVGNYGTQLSSVMPSSGDWLAVTSLPAKYENDEELR
jgi:hypothetical protein